MRCYAVSYSEWRALHQAGVTVLWAIERCKIGTFYAVLAVDDTADVLQHTPSATPVCMALWEDPDLLGDREFVWPGCPVLPFPPPKDNVLKMSISIAVAGEMAQRMKAPAKSAPPPDPHAGAQGPTPQHTPAEAGGESTPPPDEQQLQKEKQEQQLADLQEKYGVFAAYHRFKLSCAGRNVAEPEAAAVLLDFFREFAVFGPRPWGGGGGGGCSGGTAPEASAPAPAVVAQVPPRVPQPLSAWLGQLGSINDASDYLSDHTRVCGVGAMAGCLARHLIDRLAGAGGPPPLPPPPLGATPLAGYPVRCAEAPAAPQTPRHRRNRRQTGSEFVEPAELLGVVLTTLKCLDHIISERERSSAGGVAMAVTLPSDSQQHQHSHPGFTAGAPVGKGSGGGPAVWSQCLCGCARPTPETCLLSDPTFPISEEPACHALEVVAVAALSAAARTLAPEDTRSLRRALSSFRGIDTASGGDTHLLSGQPPTAAERAPPFPLRVAAGEGRGAGVALSPFTSASDDASQAIGGVGVLRGGTAVSRGIFMSTPLPGGGGGGGGVGGGVNGSSAEAFTTPAETPASPATLPTEGAPGAAGGDTGGGVDGNPAAETPSGEAGQPLAPLRIPPSLFGSGGAGPPRDPDRGGLAAALHRMWSLLQRRRGGLRRFLSRGALSDIAGLLRGCGGPAATSTTSATASTASLLRSRLWVLEEIAAAAPHPTGGGFRDAGWETERGGRGAPSDPPLLGVSTAAQLMAARDVQSSAYTPVPLPQAQQGWGWRGGGGGGGAHLHAPLAAALRGFYSDVSGWVHVDDALGAGGAEGEEEGVAVPSHSLLDPLACSEVALKRKAEAVCEPRKRFRQAVAGGSTAGESQSGVRKDMSTASSRREIWGKRHTIRGTPGDEQHAEGDTRMDPDEEAEEVGGGGGDVGPPHVTPPGVTPVTAMLPSGASFTPPVRGVRVVQ